MRALIFGFALCAAACGRPKDETPREPHGGEQATDGSGNEGRPICSTPQLELEGTVAGFAYQRTVSWRER